MQRLITVTRQDLSSGYQTVQTAHAVADYAIMYPHEFKHWHKNGNYLISLATKDQDSLEELIYALDNIGVLYIKFYEPDVDQVTAIAFVERNNTKELTKGLQLANRVVGTLNKH